MSEHATPKRLVLTEEDMAGFRPRDVFVNALEARRARLGRARDEITVVDWGCGRGELVLWLRQQGWRAFGVDVEGHFIANGRALARQRGLPADEILLDFEANYRAPFADGSVDFVTSDQVIEHVVDLDAFARETARVLKPDGEAFHVYPSNRRLIEGHLFMPLVQYTPKSAIRRALIRACVALGFEPDLESWEFENVPANERAQRYYEYSCNETFYRPLGEVQSSFRAAGFAVHFDASSIRGVQSRAWARALFEHRLTSGPMTWLVLRLGSVNLRLHKRVPA